MRSIKPIDAMSLPMISVIVPVYNAAAYLPHCIDSILKQTFSDFELLLVDDGSSDGSGRICDEYCGRDSRIRVLRLKHGGVSEARNAGLDAAAGDTIAFIDADDCIDSRYFEILNESMRGDYDIAAADFEIMPAITDNKADPIGLYGAIRALSRDDLLERLFADTSFMVVWGKLYRREILANVRFENREIAEDVEFNSRVYQTVNRAVFVPAKLYGWRDIGHSASRLKFSQRNIDAIESYVLALANMPRNNPRYRAFGLQRLYKVVLYTRYNAPADFRAAVISKAKPVVRQTFPEFVRNRYIPLMQKLSLAAFWYIPSLYALFRQRMECRARA